MISQPSMKSDSKNLPIDTSKEDVSGRDRLVWNVLFSWAAHFVFIVAGFIMPRMIDRRLSQELLGVWDFSWSLVGYFSLVQLGIGSSVNRYVAKYRSSGDTAGINHFVSSAASLLFTAGLFAFGLAVTFSLLLPRYFSVKLGENIQQAQWVVVFLGASIALEIAFSAFTGVITGCHRWGLHNFVKSGCYLLTVTAMIIALLYGRGLRSLSVIYFAGAVLENTLRVIFAHRVCEGLQVKLSLVSRDAIKKLFIFGGKTLIPSISNLLLNQTTSVMIVGSLGTAALAIYSRPFSLVHQINTLVGKMSVVLTPTVSSLQCTNNIKEIQDLLITSVRYSIYMVMPFALVLIIYGDAVMQLWMGQNYANGLLPAILMIGNIAGFVQQPVWTILGGLNAHGRAGIASFIASCFSVGLTVMMLWYFKLGLIGAALAVILPMAIMNMVYMPILISKRIGLGMRKYIISVTTGPVINTLPFMICLLAGRLFFHNEPLKGLLWGGLTGSLFLIILYYRYVLPKRIKTRLYILMNLK